MAFNHCCAAGLEITCGDLRAVRAHGTVSLSRIIHAFFGRDVQPSCELHPSHVVNCSLCYSKRVIYGMSSDCKAGHLALDVAPSHRWTEMSHFSHPFTSWVNISDQVTDRMTEHSHLLSGLQWPACLVHVSLSPPHYSCTSEVIMLPAGTFYLCIGDAGCNRSPSSRLSQSHCPQHWCLQRGSHRDFPNPHAVCHAPSALLIPKRLLSCVWITAFPGSS